ncbi:ATP-binding cassette domain-containing protein [Actinomadura litoris]|uniref:ATP-binding cassette domain-containing protein n=1 Tax=Actinomadura litoris TaxID=2678616 RepID=A0A7K1KZN8_9ACTN|nr:ATP-binding cassette domain-containing protein [Actinomadura litoris]MUN37436.1 ATP-binding cassette domain-containing protein [Actinomadura litoris]
MLAFRGVDVRVGPRLLLADVTAHIAPGDRIGLVGRNGAGKSTLMRVLAGEVAPAAGTVTRTGPVGYLPQDPAAAAPSVSVQDRVLSARGMDEAVRALRTAETALGEGGERAMRRYVRAEAEFQARGGYAAEAEAARIAAGLGLPAGALARPIGSLSGGQRRRVELARVLFGERGTLLLDEPTNNLDPASRAEVLAAVGGYRGAVVMVTHDEEAVEALRPGRVLLLPDGVEDHWNSGYADLVALS